MTARRGNFYFALAFALLAGLLVVVALGMFGITSLGIFEATTAMAMIAISITLLSIVTFVTLVTLRRTLTVLDQHAAVLAQQATQHADLAAKVVAQWRADQDFRDRQQDAELAALSARQDASFVAAHRVRAGSSHHANAAQADPFENGQVHPVRDIEGVGEHYGKLLDDMGLTDTHKLWNANATYVAGRLKIAPATVENWQSMAELMAVTGIGKQYAELLVRAGVASIDKLAAEPAERLLNRIHRLEKHQGIRLQANTIGIKIVRSWIMAAQAHHRVVTDAVMSNNGPGA